MCTDDFFRDFPKNRDAGGVHAGDVAIDVPRVDDIGGVFDDVAVMLFNSTPLGKPRDFYQ